MNAIKKKKKIDKKKSARTIFTNYFFVFHNVLLYLSIQSRKIHFDEWLKYDRRVRWKIVKTFRRVNEITAFQMHYKISSCYWLAIMTSFIFFFFFLLFSLLSFIFVVSFRFVLFFFGSALIPCICVHCMLHVLNLKWVHRCASYVFVHCA